MISEVGVCLRHTERRGVAKERANSAEDILAVRLRNRGSPGVRHLDAQDVDLAHETLWHWHPVLEPMLTNHEDGIDQCTHSVAHEHTIHGKVGWAF